MVSRGDVRWINGDGIRKPRPGVVMTRDVVAGRLRSVLVAPLTSTIRNLPSEVPLGVEHGLPQPCVASLDNLSLVDVEVLGDLIARLDAATMAALCAALAVAVDCRF
jgi:mRNA interferase MazF